MKIILLSLGQIWNTVTRNVLVFALFFVGITLSALVFFYAYGNLIPMKRWAALNHPEFRSLSVHFAQPRPIEKELLYSLEDCGVQDVWVEHDTGIYIPSYLHNLMVRSFLYNNRGGEILFTELFQSEQLSENAIILSPAHKNEGEIVLHGTSFEIVKKVGNLADDMAFIPIDAFVRSGFSVRSAHFVLEEMPDKEMVADMAERLRGVFPDGYVLPPGYMTGEVPTEDRALLFLIASIYAVALLCFLLLFLYLIRQGLYDCTVFCMAGANRRRIALSLFLQTTAFSLAAFCLAVAIHRTCYPFFDKWLNLYEDIVYTVGDYAVLLGVSVLLPCLCMFPYLFYFSGKALTGLKQKYER